MSLHILCAVCACMHVSCNAVNATTAARTTTQYTANQYAFQLCNAISHYFTASYCFYCYCYCCCQVASACCQCHYSALQLLLLLLPLLLFLLFILHAGGSTQARRIRAVYDIPAHKLPRCAMLQSNGQVTTSRCFTFTSYTNR
jgi:hypothetical protein